MYSTYNLLLSDGWRMHEIDSMDVLAFIRIRAWDARRKQQRKEHPVTRRAYIDEVWRTDL